MTNLSSIDGHELYEVDSLIECVYFVYFIKASSIELARMLNFVLISRTLGRR